MIKGKPNNEIDYLGGSTITFLVSFFDTISTLIANYLKNILCTQLEILELSSIIKALTTDLWFVVMDMSKYN